MGYRFYFEQMCKLCTFVLHRSTLFSHYSVVWQAHYMRSQELEKHLAAVLATSCEDEKQRKHNNKRSHFLRSTDLLSLQ